MELIITIGLLLILVLANSRARAFLALAATVSWWGLVAAIVVGLLVAFGTR